MNQQESDNHQTSQVEEKTHKQEDLTTTSLVGRCKNLIEVEKFSSLSRLAKVTALVKWLNLKQG